MKCTHLLLTSLALVCVPLLAQSNPVPLIYQPLSPASVNPGHAGFTLTVHGTGFVQGAVIKANGTPLKTQFFNSHTVKANVPPQAVAKAGTGLITVANPASIDSNVAYLPVRDRSETVRLAPDRNVSDAGRVAVGDFNGDRRPDITVSWGNLKKSGSYIDTFLSSGNGKFTKTGGFQPIYLNHRGPNVVGDFNNDGKLDLAVYDTDDSPDTWYDFFLGDGNGGFSAAPVSRNVMGTAADINGDGKLDFVGVIWDGYLWYLQVSFGAGDGTFSSLPWVELTMPYDGQPAVGDFNGDGKLDAAVPSNSGVAVLLGRSDGTFRQEVDFVSAFPQTRAAVADLNGDGKLDIVTNGVSVLLGDGHGNFSANGGVALQGYEAGNIELGDWNGDGKLDVATVTDVQGLQFLNLALGNNDGTFAAPFTFGENLGNTGWNDLGIGDFNSDGRLDFAVSGNKAVTVLTQAPAP